MKHSAEDMTHLQPRRQLRLRDAFHGQPLLCRHAHAQELAARGDAGVGHNKLGRTEDLAGARKAAEVGRLVDERRNHNDGRT